jgi:hypothetical protein
MTLFEFVPDETGYDHYFVMSRVKEDAIKAVSKLHDLNMRWWNANKHKYTIREHGPNEPAWGENC